MGLPRGIIELAARQGGYITRDQLFGAGLSESSVERRLRTGELTVVARSTYQVIPSSDHIDLIRGALLTLPGAVASHQSAAHLLHFPRLPKLVPTVVVPSHTTHRFPGVTVRRSDDLDKSHLTNVEGVRLTSIVRTTFDLAGVLKFKEFDVVAEALILDGRLELRRFERITNELARRGKPGSRAARDFITIRLSGDPRATLLERKGRGVIVAAGLPLPIPQYPIPWDPHRRFDDAFPDATLAIEWDSRRWHEQRAAMAEDRKRDREAALHSWYVARFTWEDVTERPDEVAATIAGLLEDRLAS